ncbi:MAG: 30S ribosomal protein S17 [Euryarchaeota archaeon RBG_13_61_15]|jgi:small subunit ribosomal protein S17|nr:MAG: 30S ribosomal protein S17 [Euryarchaeota archaeon RBG_13_61_15]
MAEKVKKAARPGVKDIGLDVEAPKETCKDIHCPFHGQMSVRGTVLKGTAVSTKMQSTVVIEKEYMRFMPKYERYEKRTSRYLAHSPPCFQIKLGDEVSIMECRPLSKRVSYVVIENKK